MWRFTYVIHVIGGLLCLGVPVPYGEIALHDVKVEDWRPITLLSCSYKLISGVVAARLEKFLPKIIGRSQKGFLRRKNINSCTINIMDRISGAWESGQSMGVLCVDFVKAFDSVEHEFIRNALLFFNFGNNMTGMVMAILTGRTARVLVGDGYSDSFSIARGTPQGDRSSPFIFIICIEVLLIMIKSMEGRGINNVGFLNDWTDGNTFNNEGTSEGFADDLTLMFGLSNEAMESITGIMEQFKLASGLELNRNKTQLMVVGTEDVRVGATISGITVVERVKILGIVIDRRLDDLNCNWTMVTNKIARLVNFWKIQKLSISGRILVAKTYLLSQVTFLLGSLDLPKDIGDGLNMMFANFIKGNDRIIARNRWCIARELGGYGMIDVHTLNTCIKSAWISKWIMHGESLDINGTRSGAALGKLVDQWGEGRYGNMDKQTRLIMREWKSYKRRFYMVGGNVWMAPLFENNGILEGHENIGVSIFGERRFSTLGGQARNVILRTLCVQGRVKDKARVDQILGMETTMVEYFRLRNFIGMIFRIYGCNGSHGKSLDEFMRSKKRGGVSSGK